MKPVYQTLTEIDPENGKFGNCFQACIASMLELPLEDVPHFAQLACEREIARGVPPAEAWKGGTDWWYMLNEWLAPRGLYYIEFTEVEAWHEDILKQLGYHLLIGKSPRGDFDHVVVARAGEIVHDPRADANGDGLRTRRAIGLFVPVEPSAPELRETIARLEAELSRKDAALRALEPCPQCGHAARSHNDLGCCWDEECSCAVWDAALTGDKEGK
jgi:hypothetical protein